MIASVHIADLGARAALDVMRGKPTPAEVRGLRYAVITTAAPLSGRLLPAPMPGRVGLIAAWHDDQALDGFLAEHPLAARLASGWRVRLRPTRVSGAWSRLPDLPRDEVAMSDDEPVAVLTLGHLRLTQTVRFLRASAAAEDLAVRQPGLLASTGQSSRR